MLWDKWIRQIRIYSGDFSPRSTTWSFLAEQSVNPWLKIKAA
jgi:hypothetical protein